MAASPAGTSHPALHPPVSSPTTTVGMGDASLSTPFVLPGLYSCLGAFLLAQGYLKFMSHGVFALEALTDLTGSLGQSGLNVYWLF